MVQPTVDREPKIACAHRRGVAAGREPPCKGHVRPLPRDVTHGRLNRHPERGDVRRTRPARGIAGDPQPTRRWRDLKGRRRSTVG